jgi:hypothetical protein
MEYKDIRPTIKSGDLIAWSSGHGWQVNIVRIFTRSEYNHVGIAWVVDDRVFVVEAVPGDGIRVALLSEHRPFYHVSHGDAFVWTADMERFMLSKVGEKYSKWEAILGFFNKTSNNARWECAELVRETYAVTDKYITCTHATPAEIVEYCMKQYRSAIVRVG